MIDTQFKIGSIVVGKEKYANVYNVTSTKRGFIGKVIELDGQDIRVQVLHLNSLLDAIGRNYLVSSKYFTLSKDNKNTVLLKRKRGE